MTYKITSFKTPKVELSDAQRVLKSKYFISFGATALVLTGIVAQVQAAGAPVAKIQTATNVDGSSLRLITKFGQHNSAQITDVFYSSGTAKPMKKIGQLVQPMGADKRALVFLTDWAKNGNYAVETVDECGAGPNCSGMIYRIDAKQQKVVEFFKTSGSHVSLVGDYLIEKARDSCCAWVADAYKLNQKRTQVATSPAFSVEIAYDEEKNKAKPVTCTFYQQTTKGRLVIEPPAKAFLQICRHYAAPYSLGAQGNAQ